MTDLQHEAVLALTQEVIRLRERVRELEITVAAQERSYQEECAIVSRIWAMFGNPSYEELKGRSIYDLIADVQSRARPLTKEKSDDE